MTSRTNLIIADMTMLRLDEADPAKNLLTAQPDLPIIICTSFNNSINEKIAASIGIKAFLSKPIKLKYIAVTVREVLNAAKRKNRVLEWRR